MEILAVPPVSRSSWVVKACSVEAFSDAPAAFTRGERVKETAIPVIPSRKAANNNRCLFIRINASGSLFYEMLRPFPMDTCVSVSGPVKSTHRIPGRMLQVY
jgi:hypothetical protein